LFAFFFRLIARLCQSVSRREGRKWKPFFLLFSFLSHEAENYRKSTFFPSPSLLSSSRPRNSRSQPFLFFSLPFFLLPPVGEIGRTMILGILASLFFFFFFPHSSFSLRRRRAQLQEARKRARQLRSFFSLSSLFSSLSILFLLREKTGCRVGLDVLVCISLPIFPFPPPPFLFSSQNGER